MRITDRMLVAESVGDHEADLRRCQVEGAPTFHVPQTVMLLSASGARRVRLWVCESHPLPATITDDPEVTQ